jgi:hypothetical protein
MSVNGQASTGYRHLNNRNMSVFNEFSKQLKGEAKRYVLLSKFTHATKKQRNEIEKKNQHNMLIALDISLNIPPYLLTSTSSFIGNYA